MKILPIVLILGLSASFVYQHLQLHSLKNELQMLDNKTNHINLIANQTESPPPSPPTENHYKLPEPSAETERIDYSVQIDKIDERLSTFERQILNLQANHIEFDNQILSLQQAPTVTLSEPSANTQLLLTEQREQAKQDALDKKNQIEERLAYEEVQSDWALPLEGKITDSITANEAFTGVEVVQAQCKSTLCEVSLFYNPENDDDLLEFENEILVSLGESLTNVHRYKKSGTIEEGYSFTLIASP